MDLCRAFFFPLLVPTACLMLLEVEELLLRGSVVVFKPRQIFNTLP